MKYILLALLTLSLTACTDTRKEDMMFCYREGGQLVMTQIPVVGIVVGCVFPKDWGNK